MPLAQKPSILRSASACAAVTPKLTPAPCAPGTGAMVTPSRAGSMPAAVSKPRSPISTHGRRPDAPALDAADIAAPGTEIRVHHQEPIHALRLRAEELDALPLRKGGECRMRRSADQIDRAVAQRRIGLVDREDQLELDVQPLALEEAELDRRNGGEIRVRDHVGHGELHGSPAPMRPLPCPIKPPRAQSHRRGAGSRSSRCAAGTARARAGSAAIAPQAVEIARALGSDRSLPGASCWRSTAPARTRPRQCGAGDRRDRAGARIAPPTRMRASLSARLAASWMPPLSPMPPIGLFTWAASPASSTRPWRKRAATR